MAILTPNSSYEVVIRIFHFNLLEERKKQTKQARSLLLQSKSLKEEALLEDPWGIPLPCPPPLPGTAPTAAAHPDCFWSCDQDFSLFVVSSGPVLSCKTECNLHCEAFYIVHAVFLQFTAKCSKISNLFQIFFFFFPFPGFPLDIHESDCPSSSLHHHWCVQFTPPLLLSASPSIPVPGSSSHQNSDNADNYQLLCSLQKGSMPACYSFCFSSLQWLWLLAWRVIR